MNSSLRASGAPALASTNTDDGAALRSAGANSDPVLTGLYDPATGKVACVLIHAAYGFADRRVNRIFDARDWFVAPTDTMVRVTAPASQWERLAAMPADVRPKARPGQ